MKPFWVIQAKEKDRETCLCKIHQNPTMKMRRLYREQVLKHQDMQALLKDITCDTTSKCCMYRQCDKCKGKKISTATENEVNYGKIIEWNTWKSRRIEREREENGEKIITKHTVTVKEKDSGTIEVLVGELQVEVERLARHEFNIRHQFTTLKKLKESCDETSAIIHEDFSENYQCKYREEIQSMHFGASKKQISIHTGVAYLQNKKVPFATISDNLKHGPAAIWAHMHPIISHLKTLNPQLNKIHVISDGPTTQYRCKSNFYLFSNKIFDYGFTGGSWNFLEAGHGKGAPDGIGAVVKRAADTLVNTHGRDITCSKDLIDGLTFLKSSILCFHIKDDDIDRQCKLLEPLQIRGVPDTMKLHQVVVNEKGRVHSRVLSCFCGKTCACFDPVTTVFGDEPSTSDQDMLSDPATTVENTTCATSTVVEQAVEQETSSGTTSQQISPDMFVTTLKKVTCVDETLVGQYTVVKYDGLPFPGIIVDVDENDLEVKVMHKVGRNRYFWPRMADQCWYTAENVITLLDNEPEHVTSRHCQIPPKIWELIVTELDL